MRFFVSGVGIDGERFEGFSWDIDYLRGFVRNRRSSNCYYEYIINKIIYKT